MPQAHEVDLNRMFSSRFLEGLFGIQPVIPAEPWGCGAAALTSILNLNNIHVNQFHVVEGSGTDKVMGASWKGLVKYASSKRMRATITSQTPVMAIIAALKARHAPLLDWGDSPGHWVIAVGFEPRLNALAFLDPIRKGGPLFGMTMASFNAKWLGQNTPIPRVMILLRKANREHKTAKGLEGRTNFRIENWHVVHKAHVTPQEMEDRVAAINGPRDAGALEPVSG